jgi:hypothetical protein
MASEHYLYITSGPLASAVWRCIPDVASCDPWIEVLRVCYEHAGMTGNLEHLVSTEGHTIILLTQFRGTCETISSASEHFDTYTNSSMTLTSYNSSAIYLTPSLYNIMISLQRICYSTMYMHAHTCKTSFHPDSYANRLLL